MIFNDCACTCSIARAIQRFMHCEKHNLNTTQRTLHRILHVCHLFPGSVYRRMILSKLHAEPLKFDYFDIIHGKLLKQAFFYRFFWSTLDYTNQLIVYYCMSTFSKKKGVYIGSKIPKNQKSILDNAIDDGDYLNISGFVRDAVKIMNEDKPFKIIKNSVCGVERCTRPVKERVVFAMGFSACFCEDCAKRLKSQGLTTETTVMPNV